jgi:hypothetical protein
MSPDGRPDAVAVHLPHVRAFVEQVGESVCVTGRCLPRMADRDRDLVVAGHHFGEARYSFDGLHTVCEDGRDAIVDGDERLVRGHPPRTRPRHEGDVAQATGKTSSAIDRFDDVGACVEGPARGEHAHAEPKLTCPESTT